MTNYDEVFYQSVTHRAQIAASEIAQIVSENLQIQSLMDVGCGEGIWIHEFVQKNPQLRFALGCDLTERPRILLKSLTAINSQLELEIRVEDFELTNLQVNRSIDLAICLEVVEHLTPKAAAHLFDNVLVKSKYLIFSGAVKGQGGTGHINENSISFWNQELVRRGLVPMDIIRPMISSNRKIPSYYRNNIVFYINPSRLSSQDFPEVLNLISVSSTSISSTYLLHEKLIHKVVSFLPVGLVTNLVNIRDQVRRVTHALN
jgi:hypothetical protein